MDGQHTRNLGPSVYLDGRINMNLNGISLRNVDQW